MILRVVVAIGLALSLSSVCRAAEDVFKNLHRAHPRLFFHGDDLPGLRDAVRNDPLLRQWYPKFRQNALRILDDKPVQHVLIGPRLLDKSRTALNRIAACSLVYLVDGDKRFAERAKLEMRTVIAFPDWNPSHFLDTAEMSNAVGIGYDWLHDYLSPDERKAIREGLIRLGLSRALPIYEKNSGWSRVGHNWNQVCNGGITVGALAIADEEPALAAQIVEASRKSIPIAMKAFAPDGGFPEGPGYWGYATIYNMYYLAAIESALGTDFGLNALPGFEQTGLHRIHFIGPVGQTFNYADAGSGAGSAPQMLYLSRIFRQPVLARHEIGRTDTPSTFHIVWYYHLLRSPLGASIDKPQSAIENLPLDAIYRGVDVAYFRSAWNDPRALYVGIKGGDNRANHSHLDLGSFVLDALGHRWAVDLGADDYNLPGYFGKDRWTYYRLRTESHNTLTLDGENQSPDGKAPIIAFNSAADRSHAVIDLTHGYRNQASRVQRGLAMLARRHVLIQDELEATRPVDVRWNFLTTAKIRLEGQLATLTQDQDAITVRILEPADARFQIVSANPPKPQRQQPNVSNLTIQLPAKTASTRIAVLISPAGAGQPKTEIRPLADWEGKRN